MMNSTPTEALREALRIRSFDEMPKFGDVAIMAECDDPVWGSLEHSKDISRARQVGCIGYLSIDDIAKLALSLAATAPAEKG